jgi:hypothetical protein
LLIAVVILVVKKRETTQIKRNFGAGPTRREKTFFVAQLEEQQDKTNDEKFSVQGF